MVARARILVVEDEPRLGELLRLYLERDGHAVTVVTDGRAAIAAFDAEPVDLVVLDLMLPGRQRRGGPRRDPRARRHAGPDRLGQAQRRRADRRPADGRRRLPRQAVQPARADRPGRGDPAPEPRRRWSGRAPASAIAPRTSRRSRSTAGRLVVDRASRRFTLVRTRRGDAGPRPADARRDRAAGRARPTTRRRPQPRPAARGRDPPAGRGLRPGHRRPRRQPPTQARRRRRPARGSSRRSRRPAIASSRRGTARDRMPRSRDGRRRLDAQPTDRSPGGSGCCSGSRSSPSCCSSASWSIAS